MHLSIVATAGACESSRWSRSSLTDRTAVDRAIRPMATDLAAGASQLNWADPDSSTAVSVASLFSARASVASRSISAAAGAVDVAATLSA